MKANESFVPLAGGGGGTTMVVDIIVRGSITEVVARAALGNMPPDGRGSDPVARYTKILTSE